MFFIFLLTACSEGNSSERHDTKDKAIEFGLQEEGTDNSSILSIEEFKNETIVFYDYDNTLGVANVSEDSNGYRWFRTEAYLDFEISGDLPYTTGSFNYETEKGIEVPILYGKLLDDSIDEIILKGDGIERELPLFNKSPFFFAIYENPSASMEVTLESSD